MKHIYYKHLITQLFIFFLILNTTHSISAEAQLKNIKDTTRFNINNQLSIVESITENIDDKIGGCTLCDELSIFDSSIDSKIDAFNQSTLPGQTSIIESIVETINNKIGNCTICDQLTTIENDLSIIGGNIDTILANIPCTLTPITTATTITQSGSYCLTNSINGTITISASQVILDLNGYTVTAIGTNSGISVGVNNSYLLIKNGIIIGSATGAAALVIANGCSNYVISDIKILFNNGIGIRTTSGSGGGTSNFTIKNCIIANTTQGISTGPARNFVLDNCTTQNCTGISFNINGTGGAKNYLVKNCIAQNGGSNGFDMTSATAGYLDNCTAENCAGTGIGFNFASATDITALGCTAQANTTKGFDLTNATKCKITNCTALNNSNIGFNSPTGNTNTIQSCTALSNGSFGFSDDGSNFFVNNYALNNTSGNYSGSFSNAPLTSKLDTHMNYWKNYDANA